ncbi:PWWP domain-containing DNA repair factor 3B-like [Pecten maximus]|uniref:PWWP domain-containing DNA repair factor 3B-like n=1 Tax=Pecten maximus TaxID=6579 RepID=UPI00145914FD|nr:PWWP domain-containing DNA repair factor 3B-like [Pecten maximus]
MEECPYKPGDYVWVKIRSCPWWPAQVIPEEECVVYHSPVSAKKKRTLAHVKFLNEISFDDITDLKSIQRLDCPDGKLLTNKGLSKKSYSEAFRAAVELAEKECGISLLPREQNRKCTNKRKDADRDESKRRQNISNKTQKRFPGATPSRKINVLPNFESDSSPDVSPEVNTEPSSKSLKTGQTKLTIKKSIQKSVKLKCLDESSIERCGGSTTPLRESLPFYTSDYSSSPTFPLSPMSHLLDSCSFDLPTPTPADRSGSVSNRLSFDPNLQKDMCDSSDSDIELPDGLSPIVGGPPFSEKDIILIRWKRYPFWPAYVKKIYWKRQQVLRISVIFIKPMENTPVEKITMRYKRKTALPFNEHEKKKILDNLQEENSKQFSMACEVAEDYLDKRVLGRWKKGIPGHLNMCESDSEDGKIPDFEDYGPALSDSMSECSSARGDLQPLDDLTNPKEQERYEKMKRRNENLIAYIKSEEMKNYLEQIYHGKKRSERHTKYHSSRTKEKASIRHAGFGPIADEEQQDDIITTLIKWHQEVQGQTPDELPNYDYVMDVWIPEAIIQGLIKAKGYMRGKATEKFAKGVILSKGEKERVHRSLIESAKHISREDWINHEEKRNIQLKEMGVNVPSRRPAKVVKLQQFHP